jgi:hypothetical protein
MNLKDSWEKSKRGMMACWLMASGRTVRFPWPFYPTSSEENSIGSTLMAPDMFPFLGAPYLNLISALTGRIIS